MNSAISNVTLHFYLMKSKLWKAARTGRVEDVKHLLIYFFGDAHALGGALKEACMCGRLKVVMWLVEHTVLRNEFDILRESLLLSIGHTQWHVTKWLARLPHVNVDCTDSTGNNVMSIIIDNLDVLGHRLWETAREGRVKEVSQFSIHFTDNVKMLALLDAWECGQLDVVMWLVKQTVLHEDVEACTEALTLPCDSKEYIGIRQLLEYPVRQNNGAKLSRALRFAIRDSNIRQSTLLKGLLQTMQAADIKITDLTYINDTMLHYVIEHNMNETSGNTALHKVYPMSKAKMCKLVYVYNKDVNAQDDDGNTALHRVCSSDLRGSSDINMVGALLLAGADETITNDDGETPAHLLVSPSYRTVKFLSLLDVSSKWKKLVRSHRLRRQSAVQVMMILVTWKVQQVRKWSNLLVSWFCKLFLSQSVPISREMSLKQIWDITDTNDELWTNEYLGGKRDQAAVKNWLTVKFIKLLYKRLWISPAVCEVITSWSLLDVSSKWKMLVRSHRLKRQTDVRVMMTQVTWRMRHIRSMWTRAITTLHTLFVLAN